MKIKSIRKIIWKPPITISTWQSIYKMQSTWFEPYGMVIGDEAHNFKAKSLAAIMEKLRDAKFRIGTTGTLDGTQCFNKNSMVKTEFGYKKIKDVSINDKVLSLNNLTQEYEYKRVLSVFNNGKCEKLLKIVTSTGVIECTLSHKILTENRGWVAAGKLLLTDLIRII